MIQARLRGFAGKRGPILRTLTGTIAYRIAWGVVWLLAHFYWRMDIQGTENVPKEGPFILSPNHRSNVDGPLTVILTHRRMRYLAKSEMFKVQWFGNLCKSMGAIPVNRGAPDRASLAACMNAMKEGYGLVLFPEGTRQTGDKIGEIHEGAAYLALRSNAPIVPVAFGFSSGAHKKGKRYLSPVKLTCIVGDPLVFDRGDSKRVTRAAIDECSQRLHDKLQELFDLAENRKVV
jgi:1-acyl-sn-glycerol-3-phosphate acyltransferase